MKALIQRVNSCSVDVEGQQISRINQGMLILLGVEKNDQPEDLDYIVDKTLNLRIYNDDENKMNLSLIDISGDALVVSQFTLCARTSKGRRPSFIDAADPDVANKIYVEYCSKLQSKNLTVKTGQFGATMQVNIVNDGPVTILLDSNHKY